LSRNITVDIVQLPNAEDLPLPSYQTAGSVGMDLYAAVDHNGVWIKPGCWEGVPLGISIALPEGYEGQVRPRSGLATRCGISMLNNPGTIDWDYNGELVVSLINHSQQPYHIIRGDRVGQLVVAPVTRVTWVQVTSLPETIRGWGGFGSTGR